MIEVMVEVFARLLNKSEAHSIYLIHLIYFRTKICRDVSM